MQVQIYIHIVEDRRADVLDARSREEEFGDVLVFEKLEGEVVQEAEFEIRPPQLRLFNLEMITEGNAVCAEDTRCFGYALLRLYFETSNEGAVFCAPDIQVGFELGKKLMNEGLQYQ